MPLPLGYVSRVVYEAVLVDPLRRWPWPVLFGLLPELLELKPLQVYLFKALHARIILHGTDESAL